MTGVQTCALPIYQAEEDSAVPMFEQEDDDKEIAPTGDDELDEFLKGLQ